MLAGCSNEARSFLDPAGPIADAQRTNFWFVVALTLIVVVPVLVGTPLIVWRYRYGNTRSAYRPRWDFSWLLEIVIWCVPVLIVAALAWRLWTVTQTLDPWKPLAGEQPATRVEAIGYDWKWLFIYPDEGVASVGELVFPQDRPVALRLTTMANMQSMLIPALAGQVYAMPGMVTRLHLAADTPGDFPGANTQFTGKSFYRQLFLARAVSGKAFDDFVSRSHDAGVPFSQARCALALRGTKEDLADALGVAPQRLSLSAQGRADNSPITVITFKDVPDGTFDSAVAHFAEGHAKKAATSTFSIERCP